MSRDFEELEEFIKYYFDGNERPFRLKSLQSKIKNIELYMKGRRYFYLPTERINTCIDEAISSYINGNMNSCIFSCVSAIDMILRFEIIENSDNHKKAYKIVKENRYSFGNIKDALAKKDNPKLMPLINAINKKTFEKFEKYSDDLDWLNKARNYIAVHPSYLNERNENDKELSSKMISDELFELFKIIDLKNLPIKLLVIDEESEIGIEDIMENPTQKSAMRIRQMNYELIVNIVASKTLEKTFKILNDLYN